MSDYVPMPTVETVYQYSKYNFTFIILAYRKVTPAEARAAYRHYLSLKRLKHPPKGETIKFQTLYGYNLE